MFDIIFGTGELLLRNLIDFFIFFETVFLSQKSIDLNFLNLSEVN